MYKWAKTWKLKYLTCIDINMKSTKLPIPQNPTVQNFSRPGNKQRVNQEHTEKLPIITSLCPKTLSLWLLCMTTRKNNFEGKAI